MAINSKKFLDATKINNTGNPQALPEDYLCLEDIRHEFLILKKIW
mgnify:CR=1 FL=1